MRSHNPVGALWVGGISHGERTIAAKNAVGTGERFQVGLAQGLAANGVAVSVLGIPPHPMWKGSGRIWVPRGRRALGPDLAARTISYVNVIGIKQVWIAVAVFLGTLVRCLHGRARPAHVIVYNSISYIAAPAIIAARIARRSTIGIIADVPLSSQRRGSSVLLRGEARRQVRLIKEFDSLVVLSECVAKDFGRPGQPWIVIEGGVNVDLKERTLPSSLAAHVRTVVFAGSLNEVSGIQLAIDAMRQLNDPALRLLIYGEGPLRQAVEAAASSPQIQYLGQRPHEEVLVAEREADLLISPRLPDNYVTRYTFPSKILEYLTTGTPILANRLEGVSEDYNPYVNYASDCNAAEWGQAIVRIAVDESGSFRKRAEAGRTFVQKSKSWNAQGGRLAEFIAAADGPSVAGATLGAEAFRWPSPNLANNGDLLMVLALEQVEQ